MKNNDKFQPVDPAITPRFAGVATFLRTVSHEVDDAVDIGFVGVPFDLGLNYRTGARQGPYDTDCQGCLLLQLRYSLYFPLLQTEQGLQYNKGNMLQLSHKTML